MKNEKNPVQVIDSNSNNNKKENSLVLNEGF